MPDYLLYSPSVETTESDEIETQEKIIQLMRDGMANVRAKDGRSERISHAKAYGLLRGTLSVPSGLAPELAQGLFAQPGTYDVLVRLANAPGEMTDDSKVNSARGMSLKVLGVSGEKVAGDTSSVQDWVLDTGKEFLAGGPKEFFQAFQGNARLAPKLSDDVKGAVSTVARVTHDALKAVGVEAQKLDFFGHKKLHPMAESYYSQSAIRYGQYVAKLGVEPTSVAMQDLAEQTFDAQDDYDAFRAATNEYFRSHSAEFDIKIQLNTGLEGMPVEDAQKAWSEDESPYREVARLSIPVQTAWDPAKDAYFEDLSFSPAHSLEAHRPLGGINRARLAAYPVLAKLRLQNAGKTENIPTSADAVPV